MLHSILAVWAQLSEFHPYKFWYNVMVTLLQESNMFWKYQKSIRQMFLLMLKFQFPAVSRQLATFLKSWKSKARNGIIWGQESSSVWYKLANVNCRLGDDAARSLGVPKPICYDFSTILINPQQLSTILRNTSGNGNICYQKSLNVWCRLENINCWLAGDAVGSLGVLKPRYYDFSTILNNPQQFSTIWVIEFWLKKIMLWPFLTIPDHSRPFQMCLGIQIVLNPDFGSADFF